MNRIYKLFIVLFLPLTILLTTVEIVSLDKEYYINKYEEYNINKSTGISQSDLHDITNKFLGYLNNKQDNLNIEKNVNGEIQQVFGEREKLHMIDVKKLFIRGVYIRNMSLMLIVSSFIALLIKDKKSIGNTLILSSAISIVFISLLSLLIYIDFNKYFTYFHKIFFTNDLWLLNPDTDVLIQMLPLEFFYSIATKIASIFISELVILIIIGLYLNRSYKNSLNGNN